MQSLVLYKCSIICDIGFGLCLCESVVVFHPSICELTVWGSMLWFDQWLEWWRWLILSWHAVLESAKDWILGVEITIDGYRALTFAMCTTIMIAELVVTSGLGSLHMGISSRPRSDEITTQGYRALTIAMCITIMVAELVVTSGLGSSLEYMVWFWEGNGYGMVFDRDNFWCSCVEMCDL
jgi:hypothetical protein